MQPVLALLASHKLKGHIMGFKRMSKMETTEPSVDEVGKGMKKGGMPMVMKDGKKIPAFAAKKGGMPKMNMGGAMMPMKHGGKTKMAEGGMPMGALQTAMAAAPAMARRRAMPARRLDPRAAMMEAAAAEQAAARPMMRKKGGEVESKSMHMKEESQIKGIKKELMTHEGKPASKAHKGLATGGVANAQGGYKKGGMPKYATGGLIQKYATGGVVNGQGGYKDGGFAKMMCEGGSGHKAMKKGGSF